MPVGVNPLNTANSVLARSTDDISYTDITGYVVDAEPNGRLRKVIERRLLGVTRVQKWTARVDHGKLKITFEYSSALFTIFDGYFTANTAIYLRLTEDDTGGTNGSRHKFYGQLEAVEPPTSPGDDETQQFVVTMAVDTYTFAAAS